MSQFRVTLLATSSYFFLHICFAYLTSNQHFVPFSLVTADKHSIINRYFQLHVATCSYVLYCSPNVSYRRYLDPTLLSVNCLFLLFKLHSLPVNFPYYFQPPVRINWLLLTVNFPLPMSFSGNFWLLTMNSLLLEP